MTNPTPAPAEALSREQLLNLLIQASEAAQNPGKEYAVLAEQFMAVMTAPGTADLLRSILAALARAEAAEAERDRLREATEKWATITRLAQYALGDPVKKKSGGAWRGYVVGYYSTSLTPIGYAVESHFEPGSVQIYPARALERWEPENE